MRLLFTTNPGIGHLLPMLPVAELLRSAGHDVAFATARSFCHGIEQKGFCTFPAGLDWAEAETARTFPEFAALSLEEQGQWLLCEVFADAAAHKMVPDLLAICASWQPDLIVRNDFEFASCVVGEKLQIPYATISVSFFLPDIILEPLIGEQLAYLRSVSGLPAYPALPMLYRHAYLSFAPPSFQPRHVPTMHALRPLISSTAEQPELPGWCATLAGRPTVYASMSSVYRVPDVFPTLIAALREEDVNLIITTGRSQDPAAFGPQPDHIHIEQFIPQAALFPYCDLFITHGPFATVVSALSHGLPLLLLPFSGELVSGALKSAELGLGRVLRRPEHSAAGFDQWVKVFSAETARAAVRELLQNPLYRDNAQAMRREIEALPGPDQVLAILGELVAERRRP